MSRSRRRRSQRRSPRLPPGLEGGQYKPLSDADVQRVHEAALRVLERTGVAIQASECRSILEAAGAKVDPAIDRVYLPPELVERALRQVNHNVVLYSRDGKTDLHLHGKRVHLGTGGAAVLVVDLETGRARESRLRDLYDIGRLVDTLDNIHFYLRPVVARDVANEHIDINTFYACLAATNKHVMGGCYYSEKVADIKRLGILIAGSEEAFLERPFLSFNLGYMVSPLRFAAETVETLTAAVRAGIPVSLVSAPQAGATAPASLVGALVQVVAEELAGITYVQLLRPGHPLLMGGMPLVSDLRTGGMVGGTAELALMNAASAQMCHFYGLPVYSSSALTESKVPDIQAGFEKGLTTAAVALAGAQYNHHSAGMLESMLTVAYEQYVIDDDINGQAMRLVRGLQVTEESLSLDVIHDVCHGEGHYLGHPQTLELMNSEFYYPHTADRSTRADWEQAGSQDMRQRARQQARRILRESFPELIPLTVDTQIREAFAIQLPLELMRPGGWP
ncbi:MAG: trimethylamine methyltransferase family protein [Candidatus Promineifilaceae bacterium]|nr:trimethylamine methyltransferase family protein [Candidatus Promineifilaceae bacterium]